MAEIIKGVLLEGNTTGLIDYNSLTNAPIFGDGTAKSHVEAWIAETESALEDREKEALYCYYDATTNKIYQDKEFTVSLSQKDIRILVANNNKNYQRQVYCYWPTYKPGNQGRYLRLTQLGGSDTEARFMNIFPVDGNYRFCSIRITGETHPTAPNTVYAEEKTFDFNTMESEITRLLEGVPYIIQGLINTNEIEDTGNYNKCPISLTKDGKSVSYNEIKKQALAGRLVYCEFDQRRIPLLTVKKEGNTGSLTFQAQLNQTFYQISVKSDNTQTLIWGPLAFGREMDKIINELYNITDGIIPEDGNSRLDLIEKKIEDLYGKGTFICWANVLNGQKVIADSALNDATPYTFRELYEQINQNPLSFCIYHLTTGYKVCALVSYEDINLEYNEKGHIIFSSTEYIIENKTTKLHLATITGDDFVNFGTSIIASNPTLKSVVNELYNVTDGVIPENGNSRLDNIESLLQRTGYLYFHPRIAVDGYLDGFISREAEDGTPLSAEELQVLIEEKGEGNVILKDNSGTIYSLNVVNSKGYRFFAGSFKRMRQVVLYNNSTKPSDMMQEYNCRYSDRNLDDEVNNLQSQIDKLNTEILAQLSIIVDGGV